MTATRARILTTLAVALPLLAVAGCHGDFTQVALVVQSDLQVPIDVDAMDVASIAGSFAPPVNPFFSGPTGSIASFPLSVGFESGGATPAFSITVRLFRGVGTLPQPTLVVSRTVTDIRFVADQTMMLVLPMNRECACAGTTCPTSGNPNCDNLANPTLLPFDPAVAPPSSTANVGGTPVGTAGAGGTTRPPTGGV